jgi:hypothetical protein
LTPVRRAVPAAVLLLLLSTGLAVAYWAGAFDRPEMTAALTLTELAPGGGRRTRGNGFGFRRRGKPGGLGACRRLGADEYYELWFGKEGGRVSAGIFVVDDRGRGELSASSPVVGGGYQRAGVTPEHQSSSQKSRASTPPG